MMAGSRMMRSSYDGRSLAMVVLLAATPSYQRSIASAHDARPVGGAVEEAVPGVVLDHGADVRLRLAEVDLLLEAVHVHHAARVAAPALGVAAAAFVGRQPLVDVAAPRPDLRRQVVGAELDRQRRPRQVREAHI